MSFVKTTPKETFTQALTWAGDRGSVGQRRAFANSVSYLVCGRSGGLSGPSIREHLCSWSLAGPNGEVAQVKTVFQAVLTQITPDGTLPKSGAWTFKAAIAHCEPICFGDLRNYLPRAKQVQDWEYHFDDDDQDLRILEQEPPWTQP